VIQKMLIESAYTQTEVLCKCCRKRYAADGVRCRTCLGSGGGESKEQKEFANSSSGKTIKEKLKEHCPNGTDLDWYRAVDNRLSGLRQRARYKGMSKCAKFTELVDLLIKQEFKCYYTDEELQPDKDLRLAHLEAVTNGGDCHCDNLVWTTDKINRMMGTMDSKTFESICLAIARQINRRIIENL